MKVFIPGLVTKTPNGSHGHWSEGYTRAKRERRIVGRALLAAGRHAICGHHIVTMTRCSPFALDDDNAVASFKHVRDEIAQWIGLKSDRDPRFAWRVEQRKVKKSEAGTEIRIEPLAVEGGKNG